MPNDVDWPESVWKEINDAVLAEVGKVRVAQKVFPTVHLDGNPVQVPDELINFQDLSIAEGQTKPFVELFATFRLTSTQVKQEGEQKTGKTLARMAAKALALAEDTYFFQLSTLAARNPGPANAQPAPSPVLPANTQIDNWRLGIDLGLLAAANPANANARDPTRVTPPLVVQRAPAGLDVNPNGVQWGNNSFAQVAGAIAALVGKGQAASYAVILPTNPYADTFIPPSPASLVTTADRIRPLAEGGFYTSPVLPANEGLLVALAGDPVQLFVGREVTAEFVVRQGNNYVFRVVERVQYVVRDPRALVLLRFAAP
jgi:uncharacterized linocin/CFP29 family protein